MTPDELGEYLGLMPFVISTWDCGPPTIFLKRKTLRYRKSAVDAWLSDSDEMKPYHLAVLEYECPGERPPYAGADTQIYGDEYLMDSEEAAFYLNVTKGALAGWVYDGTVRFQEGKRQRTRFRKRVLDKWLEERTKKRSREPWQGPKRWPHPYQELLTDRKRAKAQAASNSTGETGS